MTAPPPLRVAILGIDSPIGLTLVRELARHGVAVYGVARSRRGVGLYSRHLTQGFVHPGRNAALIDRLAELGRVEGIPYLLAISEPDLLFLQHHQAALAPMVALIPDADKLALVLDKARTYALAQEVGIQVPRLWTPPFDEPITAWPVVLKWADPPAVAPRLSAAGLAFNKAEYCHTPAQLEAALTRYQPMGLQPLVQSYHPGFGLGHMLFMHQGEPLLIMQHRRLHEWPPEGGVSSLCETLPHTFQPHLLAQSIALLRRIQWEGAAMVEYRYDPATGQAVLMEVNGRFWGSLPLAYRAGAEFGWWTVQVLGLGQIPPVTMARAGVRARFMAPELRRLATIFFHQERIQDHHLRFSKWRELLEFFGGFVDPALSHYVYDHRDPLPFWRDAASILAGLLAKIWGGKDDGQN